MWQHCCLHTLVPTHEAMQLVCSYEAMQVSAKEGSQYDSMVRHGLQALRSCEMSELADLAQQRLEVMCKVE